METEGQVCNENPAVVQRAYNGDDNQVYVVGDNASRTGILLIGDIFGMLDNSKRFADRLAKEGHLVVMPDFFLEHTWPAEKADPSFFATEEWKEYMQFITDYAHFRPKAERGIALLRKMGCKKVTSIGLCWGARLAFDLARDGLTDACATAHPAFFTAHSVKAAKTPVCVLPAKEDPDDEDVEKAVSKHKKKPSVFKRYDKLSHGYFGCRFDYDKATEEEKHELDSAMKVMITFLHKAMK